MQTHGARIRTIAFWVVTAPIVLEMVAGAVWDLTRIEYVRVVMAHLGYPVYLLSILGVWKLAGAAALVAPRSRRLQEWAYAGCFFNYSGAAASHVLAGDAAERWLPLVIFSAVVVASWWLRPADRPANRFRAWAIPAAVLAVLVAVSYVTLPSGPPPGYAPSVARGGS